VLDGQPVHLSRRLADAAAIVQDKENALSAACDNLTNLAAQEKLLGFRVNHLEKELECRDRALNTSSSEKTYLVER
jgi:hypothetical protein